LGIRCSHKRRIYKIEKLYPTKEFEERLVFQSKCEYCDEYVLKLVFYREDDSKWTQKYIKDKAKEKYLALKPEIMCIYNADLHPELDIGVNYFDGANYTVRKLHNSAIVEHYISPDMIYNIQLMLMIKLISKKFKQAKQFIEIAYLVLFLKFQ